MVVDRMKVKLLFVQDYLERYGQLIRKEPPLSEEEQRQCAMFLHNMTGNLQEVNELWHNNIADMYQAIRDNGERYET